MSVVPTKTELIDLFWRSLWTFIASLGGAQIVNAYFHWDISNIQMALISGGGAVFTVLKVYASNKLGTGTATSKEAPVVGLPPVASNVATPSGGMK